MWTETDMKRRGPQPDILLYTFSVTPQSHSDWLRGLSSTELTHSRSVGEETLVTKEDG